MKKLIRLLALLLACMMVFGTVSAAAETDVDEIKAEEEEDGEEAAEDDPETVQDQYDWDEKPGAEDEPEDGDHEAVVWVEYEFKGLRFLLPEDWEVVDDVTSLFIEFEQDSEIMIHVFDPESEEIPGSDAAEMPEDYGWEILEFIEGSEPESLEQYSYTLNGLDFTGWYANNAKNEDYYDSEDETGNVDYALFRFKGEDIGGYVFAGFKNDELKSMLNGLIGLLFSLAPAAEEAPVEEEAAETGDEAADEDEEIEEIIEEIEEVIEEAEEEAEEEAGKEAEEAAEDTDAEAEDVESEEDADDEDAADEENGPLVWIDKETSGIRFSVPEDWDETDEGDGFSYAFGDVLNAAIETIPVAEFEDEISCAEEYFAVYDDALGEFVGMLEPDAFGVYEPFKLSGLDMKLYFISLGMDEFRFDYLYTIFYGEETAGYSMVMIFSDGETDTDALIPVTLRFITSHGAAEEAAAEAED